MEEQGSVNNCRLVSQPGRRVVGGPALHQKGAQQKS